MICSDDVDKSFAFLDFCKARRLEPVLLLDRRKVFGVTRVAPRTE